MLSRIFHFQSKTITLSAFIVGISYLVSAFLGILRDRLLAGHFGAGIQSDAYFAAFRVPDFIFNILVLGGLTFAFMPLFSEYFSKNKEDAWKMTNHVLNVFLFFLIIFSLILFALTPFIAKFIFPNFSAEETKLFIPLARILFLSPIFFTISSILSSLLQYFHRFLIYSLAPIFYNLGIILGIIFLTPYFGIFGVAIGVVVGAICHALVQLPAVIQCGFKYKLSLNFKHPAIGRVTKLMFPRVFSIASQQINILILTIIASSIAAGSITFFVYSNNFQSLTVAFVGASFGVAIFPVLSQNWAEGKKEEFLKNLSSTIRKIIFLTVPISALLIIFATPIIRVFLGTGKFTLSNASLTGMCLSVFSVSIIAQALIQVLCRGFFAFRDTKTPTFIAIFGDIIAIGAALLFVRVFQFDNFFSNFWQDIFGLPAGKNLALMGLPLAFSISTILKFFVLYWFLRKKVGDFGTMDAVKMFLQLIFATFLMGATVLISNLIFSSFISGKHTLEVLIQALVSGGLGIVVYILVLQWINVREMKDIKDWLFKIFIPKNVH